MMIAKDRRNWWIVVWRWGDGILWPLNLTMRRTRRDAIAAFVGLNNADYRALRKQGKAKAVKVRLELVP